MAKEATQHWCSNSFLFALTLHTSPTCPCPPQPQLEFRTTENKSIVHLYCGPPDRSMTDLIWIRTYTPYGNSLPQVLFRQ